jgi:hypothetical protein
MALPFAGTSRIGDEDMSSTKSSNESWLARSDFIQITT